MFVLNTNEIRNIEQLAINGGIPSTRLMENAGIKLALCCGNAGGKRVAVFANGGKNGGDGLVAARWFIKLKALSVRVFMPGSRGKIDSDTLYMENRLNDYGCNIEEILTINDEIKEYCRNADIIVDALFGIGLNRDISGINLEVIRFMNTLPGLKVSADIPSGINADTGAVMGDAVKADKTVTFTLPKRGHFIWPGYEYKGELCICDVGVPPEIIKEVNLNLYATDSVYLNSVLNPRKRETHKFDYGKVLLICGSEGYSGAAFFASASAVRAGSGVVYTGVPRSIYQITASKLNEPVVFPLISNDYGTISSNAIDAILERLSGCDACLIGPGLSRGHEIPFIVEQVLKKSRIPVVLDADGINAINKNIFLLKSVSCPLILTPHEGEFDRLTEGAYKKANRLQKALEFSREHNVTLLLKGHRTVIAAPSGKAYINLSGNPGMAKGGSGDVLAGIIVSLLGQGLAPIDAAVAGAYIHGLAGDLCAFEKGEYGMTPTDIIDAIPKVIKNQFESMVKSCAKGLLPRD